MNKTTNNKPWAVGYFIFALLLINCHAFSKEQHHSNIPEVLLEELKSITQPQKLLPTPSGIGGVGSSYGRSISVDGNRALIGASGLEGTGVVFVLEFDGINWIETARLKSNDIAADDGFGTAVSLFGDRALIGAVNDDGIKSSEGVINTGAVYVFEFNDNSWHQTQKLIPTSDQYNLFGISISYFEDTALIGALVNLSDPQFRGEAYVFDFDGNAWNETQRLSPGDPTDFDFFGQSVSLSGTSALIGAPFKDSTGAVYVFEYDGSSWFQSQKLTADDGAGQDRFGRSVSQLGDLAVVGANGDDDVGDGSGSVYVFENDGIQWVQHQKLTENEGQAGVGFGFSVLAYKDQILISAPAFDKPSIGTLYTFENDGFSWNQVQSIKALDGASGDSFGYTMAHSMGHLLVSSFYGDGVVTDAGAVYAFNVGGSGWAETQKLIANEDGAASGNFGYSVSLGDHRAIIGAYNDSTKGLRVGAAYIFDFNGEHWVLTQKLFPEDKIEGGNFGIAVGLYNNRALVASHKPFNSDNNPGAVYVYDYQDSMWQQTQKISSDVNYSIDLFPSSLALNADMIFIGASGLDGNGENSGAVYVYHQDGMNWVKTQELMSSDAEAFDGFGRAISVSDEQVIITQPGDDDQATNSGAAFEFIFDGMSWIENQKIVPSDGTSGDAFGTAVSLSNDKVLIGAPEVNGSLLDSGAAYVYEYDSFSWTERMKLEPNDAGSESRFGYSVAISGNQALVGSPFDDSVDTNSGAAYLFDLGETQWVQSHKFINSSGSRNDNFGHSVSLSSGWSLLGASGDDVHGIDSGSALVIDVSNHLTDLIFFDGFD